VGLCDVEISRRGGWLRCCALARGDLSITAWMDAEVDGHIDLVSEYEEMKDGVLEMCLLFEATEGKLYSVELESPPNVRLPFYTYGDEDELVQDVAYSFDYVHSMPGDDIFSRLDANEEWQGTFLHKPIKLAEYEYSDKSEGEITQIELTFEDETVALAWTYRPDWIGLPGFEDEEAYRLRTEFESPLERFPSWALPAWLLTKTAGTAT
jgi:hypothetical protein